MARLRYLAMHLTLLAVVGAAAADDRPAPGNDKPAVARPHLEFRIAANIEDDGPAIKASRVYFDVARKDAARQATLKQRASDGLPPEPIKPQREGTPGSSWVEIGPSMLRIYRLDDASEKDTSPAFKGATYSANDNWKRVAAAREKGEPYDIFLGQKSQLIWSRPYSAAKRPEGKAADKRFEYFLLLRDTAPGKAVTEKHLVAARAVTEDGKDSVEVELNKEGGELMHELTSRNKDRVMAITVDGVVVFAPTIYGAIGRKARIAGLDNRQEAERIAAKLQADISR